MAFVSELVSLVVAGGRYAPWKYFYMKIQLDPGTF
jgi:hypothetical protein